MKLQADEPDVITPVGLGAEAAFEVVPDGVIRVTLPFKAGVRSSATLGATERVLVSRPNFVAQAADVALGAE